LAAEKAAERPKESQGQKHLQKMLDPRRGRALRSFAKLLKLVVGAVVCAAIIVMLLPPDLPAEPKTYTFAPMINMDLTSALSSHRTAPLIYSEEQVNSFIASNLRRKDSPAKEGYFPLERVTMRFDEGSCAISTKRNLFGLAIYSGGSYRLSTDNGKLVPASNGGFVGRLSIPPGMMKLASPLLDKTWTTFGRERNNLTRLAAIEFHPQSVSLIAAR
jgi:hypothetical protein